MNISFILLNTFIVTTAVSFIMDFKRQLEIFKDLADAGYKINTEKTLEFKNSINIAKTNEIQKEKNIKLLIPIYNLAEVLCRYQEYYNTRNEIIYTLSTIGLIEEMTKEEKEEYSKKKTSLNALLVWAKSERALENALVVVLNDGSKIWFEWDTKKKGNELENIKIFKVEGRASLESETKQKEYVFKIMAKFYTIIESKYNSVYNAKDILYQNNSKIKLGIREEEIDKIIEEISKTNINIYEKVEETKSIIDERVNYTNYSNEEITDKKNRPKIKKRKL